MKNVSITSYAIKRRKKQNTEQSEITEHTESMTQAKRHFLFVLLFPYVPYSLFVLAKKCPRSTD